MSKLDWRTVTLPPRMRHLPRDARGFPIPAIVLRDGDGKPHFAANDQGEVNRLGTTGCHVCGLGLLRNAWFTGGALSAFGNGRRGAYIDGPMHFECVSYAMQVCPHLAHRMKKAVAPAVVKQLAHVVDYVEDRTTMPGIPEVFVMVKARRIEVQWDHGAPVPLPTFIVPRPFLDVIYWRDGERLSPADGKAMVRARIDQYKREGK